MADRTLGGDLEGYDFSEAVGYHYDRFPPGELELSRIIGPLGHAREALARYDQMLSTLRNSSLLLAPMRRQEAIVSSRIEGTVTTLDALLQYEADEASQSNGRPARDDTLETYLYAKAMQQAETALEDGWPLSRSLLRETHRTLLRSGRGRDKRPGLFKESQNYIADKITKQVMFIPIAPAHLPPALEAFDNYINQTPSLDPLIQTAIAHAEFEALHPFDDGNGRIGRMLVTLMLWRAKMLSGPHLFLSAFIEREKDQYIARLRNVSASDDWTGWCVFFLEALTQAARESLATANKITELYEEMRDVFRVVTASQWHTAALDFVFEKPVFANSTFTRTMTERCAIGAGTAQRFTRELASDDRDILRVVRQGAGRAPTIYAFEPLLKILRI